MKPTQFTRKVSKLQTLRTPPRRPHNRQEPSPTKQQRTRDCRMPNRFWDYQVYYEFAALQVEATSTVKEGLESLQAEQWKLAMQKALEQLNQFEVYEKVDSIPQEQKPMNTKWVLRGKRDVDVNLIKYKARLVDRDFTQFPGLHFNGICSPVAQPEIWQILISMTLCDRWVIEQWHMKTVFLNCELHYEV